MNRREQVYEAIDGERDYQDMRWRDALNRSLAEYALYIHGYTNKLTEKAATSDDSNATLEIVRKIGGLAVACMERHGAPKRKST